MTFSLSIPTQACPWWAPHWMSNLFSLKPFLETAYLLQCLFNPQTRPFPSFNSLLLLHRVSPSKTHSKLLNPWETFLQLTHLDPNSTFHQDFLQYPSGLPPLNFTSNAGPHIHHTSFYASNAQFDQPPHSFLKNNLFFLILKFLTT